ncbi:MAG: hypothetical protein AAF702_38685 [Chloroflexota bacterium]
MVACTVAFLHGQMNRHATGRFIVIIVLSLLLWLVPSINANAQSVIPEKNPNLLSACGLDIALVLDASYSISNESTPPEPSEQDQVRAATQNLVDVLSGTGSRLSIVEFASSADTPIPYTPVTQASITDTFQPYIHGTGGGGNKYHDGRLGTCTNWDGAFRQVNLLLNKPDLVLFVTDGRPNTVHNGPICEASLVTALDAAATQANITKSGPDGAHIFAIGIGGPLVPISSLEMITERPAKPYNTLNFSSAEYVLGTPQSLYTNFQNVAYDLCGESLTVTKLVDEADGNGYMASPGWVFSGTLDIPSGGYSWIVPDVTVGDSRIGTTGSDGTVQFQWDTPQPNSSNILISENLQPGYNFVDAQCTVRRIGGSDTQPLPIEIDNASFTAQLQSNDIATCTVRNAKTRITLNKSVSPTSVPESGGQVTYTYEVSNAGALPATLTSLTDDRLGDLDGQGTCLIENSTPVVVAPGSNYSCEVTTTVAGDPASILTNIGTVSATVGSTTVSASDSARVSFTDVRPTADIQLDSNPASLPEPGGLFSFTVSAFNTSGMEALTLTELTYGTGEDLTQIANAIVDTTCQLPQILQPTGSAGDSYSCAFVLNITEEPGVYVQRVSAKLADNEDNEIAPEAEHPVTILDVIPLIAVTQSPLPSRLPEPGGPVSFTVKIENKSIVESFTVESLEDSTYGNVASISDSILATTCSLPQTLASSSQAGDGYTCYFQADVLGNAGEYTNELTVKGRDNESNQLQSRAASTVILEDVPASIDLTIRADSSTIPEPGEAVSYTVEVFNSSLVDTIVITKLVDSLLGDLSTFCAAPLPVSLAVGENFFCQFSETIMGEPGDKVTSEVVAEGVDDDGMALKDIALERVEIINVPSSIDVTKSANVSEVMEPGGDVTFTLTIQNNSPVDTVEINSVIDDQFGDVGATCSPSVPFTLLPSETATCVFSEFIGGSTGETHVNIVTVTGLDDDGETVMATDQEEIDIDNVPSSIKVIQSATPTGIFEPGGTVIFTIEIVNFGQIDTVTIEGLLYESAAESTEIGALCEDPLPQILLPGESLFCTVSKEITGTSAEVYTNRVTARGVDDDGFEVQDFDQESISIFDLPASLRTTIQANQTNVPEPGGDVQFNITVENTSAVDLIHITSIIDESNSNGSNNDRNINTKSGVAIQSCTESLPIDLAPGEKISCGFTRTIRGPVGTIQINEVTVFGTDLAGALVTDSAQETVSIVNLPSILEVTQRGERMSVNEPGEEVSLSINIANRSVVDTITVERVVNEVQEDISSFCVSELPVELAPGEMLFCAYDRYISGVPGSAFVTSVSVAGTDDDGQTVAADDTLSFDIIDLIPNVSVVQMADLSGVPESGDFVTFSIIAINQSPGEPATLTGLNDSLLGDLNGQGDCQLPQVLGANGGSYTCSYMIFVDGNAAETRSSILSATVQDDDGNVNAHDDTESLHLVDVKPDIRITLTPSPTAILETGEVVSYTVEIINIGPEDTSLRWLSTVQTQNVRPQRSSDLAPTGQTPPADCNTLDMLAANGGRFTCTFSTFRAGPAGTEHRTEVLVLAQDDDGNLVNFSADATVRFTQAAPVLGATKVDGLIIDLVPPLTGVGVATPGDTLGYTITVTNTGNGAATNVNIQDIIDPATTLVIGTVQTSRGTVVRGNNQGNTDVLVIVPELRPSATVVVTFHVQVKPGIDVRVLRNQAQITYDSTNEVDGATSVETIDPSDPGGDGITRTPSQPIPTSLPIEDEPEEDEESDGPEIGDQLIFLPLLQQ